MKYLPFEKYTLSILISPEEAKRRLLDNLEPERNVLYIMKNSTKPYTGTISADGFAISRIIRYRNSFLPVIKGRFMNDKNRTTVLITMRPPIFVLIFMSIWTSGVLLACVATLAVLIDPGKNKFSPAELIPFGMLLFGYGLVTIGFKTESIKSKKFLSDLFDGNE